MMTRQIAVVLAFVAALAAPLLARGTELRTVKGTVQMPEGAGSPSNVVVYLEGDLGAPTPTRAIMDQKDLVFEPHVIAIPAGSTVEFRNSDPVLHNILSTSPAKKFDVGMFARGETRSETFDTPGVVELRCNVHPKMRAFIVVRDNNFFAIPDEQGNFTITNVPPGRYRIRTWHETLKPFESWVNVEEAKIDTVNVRLR